MNYLDEYAERMIDAGYSMHETCYNVATSIIDEWAVADTVHWRKEAMTIAHGVYVDAVERRQ